MNSERTYLPAAGCDALLPFYDLITKLMGADKVRRALLDHVELRPGHRVLDLGCGTGTLTVELKRRYTDVEVVGLDPDPKALARAANKAQRQNVSLQLDQGFSDSLPYPSASFDRVFSSFMFHHLKANERESTLREIRRVLKPPGFLLLLDFETPESGGHNVLSHIFHSHAQLKDNSPSRILELIHGAELADATKIETRVLLFNLIRVACYRAFASERD